MGYGSNRLAMRREARANLRKLIDNADMVNFIHYSCESFYDYLNGASRRITSIAVLHFASGQVQSFSIHRMAERELGNVSREELEQHYDDLERKMLAEFSAFIAKHPKHTWVHWNMRDSGFGFPAIEHRYMVLSKKQLMAIPDADKVNLPELLEDLYGKGFVKDPQFENLMELNSTRRPDQPEGTRVYKDFLSGEEEGKAFEAKEYVKLHASTLRKVQLLRKFTKAAWRGTLKTEAGPWQRSMESVEGVIVDVTDHWLYKAGGGVGIVVSIVGVLGWIVGWF